MAGPDNSMTRPMEPATFANYARNSLKRAKKNNPGMTITIVIVEGNSDRRLYAQIFDARKSVIEPVEGKNNVLAVVRMLLEDFPGSVIGVVDDDFDSLEGNCHKEPYIISTDAHDFETQLIFSPALEKIINHVMPDEKLGFVSQFVEDLKTELVKIGSPLGYIRWISKKEHLNICFRRIQYGRIVCSKDKKIDISLIIDELLSNNKHLHIDKQQLIDKIQELQSEEIDPRFLCQGHDLVNIFIIIVPELLKSYISTTDKKFSFTVNKVNSETAVREKLIMSYEMNHFRKTRTYSKIKTWEIRNQPTGILREE